LSSTQFAGFRRPDGSAGTRNHVLVLPAVVCASGVAQRIAQRVPGTVTAVHQHGCSQIGADKDQTQAVLAALAAHPNVGAVLVVGLGCATVAADDLAAAAAAAGKPAAALCIEQCGGTPGTLAAGARIAEGFVHECAAAQRAQVPLAELVLGTNCGGSDAFSGLTANPAIGVAADLLVAAGGTVVMAETTEMIGAEHLLAARCAEPAVAEQLFAMVRRTEEATIARGAEVRGANPARGNLEGGISTLEEKSLGCIQKGGSTPVREVLGYGQRPSQRGLVLMDTPGHDIESLAGIAAGGCQVIVFSTGRGSPVGFPIVPVIKIATHSVLYERMSDDMDLNAGVIIEDRVPVGEFGRVILERVVSVASGELTCAERHGHHEFGLTRLGPSL